MMKKLAEGYAARSKKLGNLQFLVYGGGEAYNSVTRNADRATFFYYNIHNGYVMNIWEYRTANS